MVAVGQMFMDTFFYTLTAEGEAGEEEGTSRRGVSREEFITRLVEEATSEERMVEGYGSDGEGEEREGDGDEMMEQVAESQQQASSQPCPVGPPYKVHLSNEDSAYCPSYIEMCKTLLK